MNQDTAPRIVACGHLGAWMRVHTGCGLLDRRVTELIRDSRLCAPGAIDAQVRQRLWGGFALPDLPEFAAVENPDEYRLVYVGAGHYNYTSGPQSDLLLEERYSTWRELIRMAHRFVGGGPWCDAREVLSALMANPVQSDADVDLSLVEAASRYRAMCDFEQQTSIEIAEMPEAEVAIAAANEIRYWEIGTRPAPNQSPISAVTIVWNAWLPDGPFCKDWRPGGDRNQSGQLMTHALDHLRAYLDTHEELGRPYIFFMPTPSLSARTETCQALVLQRLIDWAEACNVQQVAV